MRIIYLSASYVPSRRASSVQVMKMCEAFAAAGHSVTLLTKRCPPRQEPAVRDPYAFYGVAPTFDLRPVSRPSVRGGGLIFLLGVARYLLRHRRSMDLVYSREMAGAWIAAALGIRVIIELHDTPPAGHSGSAYRRLLRSPRLEGVVTISNALRAELARRRLLPAHGDVLVAHDGADLPPQAATRRAYPAAAGGTESPFRVGYVGSLARGKGADWVVELARRAPEIEFHIAGGDFADLARLCGPELPGNLRAHGFVEHGALGGFYEAMDVLIMPYGPRVFGVSEISEITRFMSPLKMFEYMATGRAIVSSDLPVIREVLRHEDNALLVPPRDRGAWVAALRRLNENDGLRRRLGERAKSDLERGYTWRARADKVLGPAHA